LRLPTADEDSTPEGVAAAVAVCLARGHQAARDQNLNEVIRTLDAAVGLYEQHPTYVREPDSHLRVLLVFIRSARSLCKTLDEREDELRELEERAEALRRPLH
jgi:hypothetical protein